MRICAACSPSYRPPKPSSSSKRCCLGTSNPQNNQGRPRSSAYAPNQFVRIQFGGVARQKMQTQLPFGRFDVVANDASLVRRKAIENQTHGLLTAMHQLAQQLDKQLTVQTTHVGAEPKLPARTHRRGGGNRLPLPRSVHNRSLAAQSPCLSMNGVGAKTGFIPKENLRAVVFRLAGQCRIRLLLPQGNRLRISLIRALQRFLR